MNALELADELHKIYIQEAAECWDVVEEAANLLRQQQAEIEALKEALRMKVILNEHAQQAMKGYKELLK